MGSVRPEGGKLKNSKPLPTVSKTSRIKDTEQGERALQKRTGGHSKGRKLQ